MVFYKTKGTDKTFSRGGLVRTKNIPNLVVAYFYTTLSLLRSQIFDVQTTYCCCSRFGFCIFGKHCCCRSIRLTVDSYRCDVLLRHHLLLLLIIADAVAESIVVELQYNISPCGTVSCSTVATTVPYGALQNTNPSFKFFWRFFDGRFCQSGPLFLEDETERKEHASNISLS